MRATRYGDPLGKDELDMGPVINKTQVSKMKALVDSALAAGAEAVTGGKVADLGSGNHYEPTVLVNVTQDMDVIRHETFGPVLPVVTVSDLDEAIAHANDTTYGLTSSIYTRRTSTRPSGLATSCDSARPTSTAKTSRRCRASMPGAVARVSAAPTASTGARIHRDPPRLHPDSDRRNPVTENGLRPECRICCGELRAGSFRQQQASFASTPQ
jgi:hypothetical protein